jgi:hypothetical protein
MRAENDKRLIGIMFEQWDYEKIFISY